MSKLDRNEIILITGGSGFLGSTVIQMLKEEGFQHILAPTSKEMNLLNADSVLSYLEKHKPNSVIHMASLVFGLGGNLKNQMRSAIENTQINNNLFYGLTQYPVSRLFFAGTAASYPYPYTKLPLSEDMFFEGLPHYGEFGYAMAKRHAYTYLRILSEEYGTKFVYGIFTNLYGINDRFNIETGHIIPSLVAKSYHAKQTGGPLYVWGNGDAERDFLHAKDAAEAILFCLEHENNIGLINISSGISVTIRNVAEHLTTIAGITDCQFQSDKPVGIPKRVVDNKKLKDLGFKTKVSLQEGLLEVFNWYSLNEGARGEKISHCF